MALFFVAAFSPPEVKAQALSTHVILTAGDTTEIVPIAPYGDDVTVTIIDSSDTKVDTVKIWEVLPGGMSDSIILVSVQWNTDGGYDSSGVFVIGDNKIKTFTLTNRQPYKLFIVRTNANNYSPRTHVIVSGRTRFMNAIPKSKEVYGYASIENEKRIIQIEDKFGKLKININESAVLLPPWVVRATSKDNYYKKE